LNPRLCHYVGTSGGPRPR